MLRLRVGVLLGLLFCGVCAGPKKIPYPVKHGYRFEFDMEGAGEVKLIGSWNNWDADAHSLHRWGSYYWLDVDITAGRYEYFFLSTTGRILPQNTGETVDDGFGGLNAVAVVE
jgi:hypothetical protein